MLQGRFSVSSDFPKPSKINKLQTKKDSIPIAGISVQPLARIRRNRQRPPSNGSIERARNTAPPPHAFVTTHLRSSTSVNQELDDYFLVVRCTTTSCFFP